MLLKVPTRSLPIGLINQLSWWLLLLTGKVSISPEVGSGTHSVEKRAKQVRGQLPLVWRAGSDWFLFTLPT